MVILFLFLFFLFFCKTYFVKVLADETVIEVLGVILLICSSVVLSVNLTIFLFG